MALEWLQGFVVGAAVGAAPTLFFLGGQIALQNFMESRSAMVREVHKAVVDIGGRIGSYFNNESKPHGKVEENSGPRVADSNRVAAFNALVAPAGEFYVRRGKETLRVADVGELKFRRAVPGRNHTQGGGKRDGKARPRAKEKGAGAGRTRRGKQLGLGL